MSRPASIHSWPASYYVSGERRWRGGVLSLTRTALRFVCSRPRAEEEEQEEVEEEEVVLLSLPMSRVVELKAEASSLIFSALTVLEEGKLKHWFCSLKPSRAAAFTVLQHFWREGLLGGGGGDGGRAESRGRSLIGLVGGAQRQLEETSRVLGQQGEQFTSMVEDLDKVESDLGVADRLLSELESPPWWPFGKFPWRTQVKDEDAGAASSPGAAPCAAPCGGGGSSKVLAIIPAVFSQGSGGEPRPGELLLLPSSLEVRDGGGRPALRLRRGDVDEVRVHSPYEVTVRRRFIGRPDVRCRLLSAKMAAVLPLLQLQYGGKLEFGADFAAFAASPPEPRGAAGHAEPLPVDSPEPLQLPAGDLDQIQVLAPSVSRAEAQELRQMLQQLKGLALEAESELERQEEVLDVLTESVDRRSLNIEKQTNRMRRLL